MPDELLPGFTPGEDITIIDQEGKVLVNQLTGKYNETEIGVRAVKVATHLLQTVEKAVRETNWGLPETILIQGNNGKFCVLPANNGKFFVTLVGNIL